MRGQSSVEMLILVGAIMIAVSSMLYLGTRVNELEVVMRAARDGAENAISTINAEYGCSIDVEGLGFDAGTITISVVVRDAPPHNFSWDNFRDNIIKRNIREGALLHIQNAVGGFFPATPGPVKTARYTYDVTVEVRRVTK